MKKSKVRTSLYIDKDLLERAKKKVNISRFLEEKLIELLDEDNNLNKVNKENKDNTNHEITKEDAQFGEKEECKWCSLANTGACHAPAPGSNPGRRMLLSLTGIPCDGLPPSGDIAECIN